MTAAIDGTVADGFGGVADAFAANFAERGEVGAAVCVYRDGVPVVDLWGGVADPQDGRAWARDTVVSIGDRCLIGRGSGIVGHFAIDIGDDVWTGHHVYITDQNHGYEDIHRPISAQTQPERAVRIGDGSLLGFGTVVLPGVTIGRHVVIGANSVVTSDIPDFSVAVGAPARVIRRFDGTNWVAVPKSQG